MKRVFILASLLLATQSSSFAQKSTEPLDFRGIEWDTHYSAVRGMQKTGSKNEKINHKKQNEDMTLGPCELKDLRYEGYSGRIYKVIMRLSECPTTKVFNMFKQKYGECARLKIPMEHYICTWDWKRVKLEYAIDIDNAYTKLHIHTKSQRTNTKDVKERSRQKRPLLILIEIATSISSCRRHHAWKVLALCIGQN